MLHVGSVSRKIDAASNKPYYIKGFGDIARKKNAELQNVKCTRGFTFSGKGK
jgi:hypothetical protein